MRLGSPRSSRCPRVAKAASDEYARAEAERVQQLDDARAAYAAECEAREAEVAAQNADLDSLIADLGYGATEAVEEYISIVLSNSVYPDRCPVRHEYTFDPGTAELALRCLVPGPTEVPAVKAYKYTKSSDDITEAALSQKAAKDRYAGAVHQVALRSWPLAGPPSRDENRGVGPGRRRSPMALRSPSLV